jgi:hypothetical protein
LADVHLGAPNSRFGGTWEIRIQNNLEGEMEQLDGSAWQQYVGRYDPLFNVYEKLNKPRVKSAKLS